MSDVQQRIDQLVKDNDVVLFMKGNANFPMCGFSGRAIQLLKASGVDTKTLTTINVLDDADIRQGIKEYSNWPTIPQLYVKGEFIGGSDITELSGLSKKNFCSRLPSLLRSQYSLRISALPSATVVAAQRHGQMAVFQL